MDDETFYFKFDYDNNSFEKNDINIDKKSFICNFNYDDIPQQINSTGILVGFFYNGLAKVIKQNGKIDYVEVKDFITLDEICEEVIRNEVIANIENCRNYKSIEVAKLYVYSFYKLSVGMYFASDLDKIYLSIDSDSINDDDIDMLDTVDEILFSKNKNTH